MSLVRFRLWAPFAGTAQPLTACRLTDAGVPHAGIAHLVERHLAKVEVASSSLVARSSSGIPITAPFPPCGENSAMMGIPSLPHRNRCASLADASLGSGGAPGFYAASLRSRRGFGGREKFLSFFKKGVDFFGEFAYNIV